MKGLLFGGCSFTWGQGLYFYSDLPKLHNPKKYDYDADFVTEAQKKFKDTIRYPRLVANHFNTFESFKKQNGGSEDETFDFFKTIFGEHNNRNEHLTNERHSYEDFSYIIIQLSQLFRNRFYFSIDDTQFWCNMPPQAKWGNTDNLLKWMEINNFSVDDWKDQLVEQQYVRLLNELKFYEDKGIKTKILTWEDDLLGKIKTDDYLNSRFIQLHYNGEIFDTIKQLQQRHSKMYIEHDPYFNGFVYNDHHPSKLCHQVIAENIINNIQKDLK